MDLSQETLRAMPPPHPIGLCRDCRHAATSTSRSGSLFYRCRLSETDTRFPKYPPLPVLHCAGHEPAGSTPPTA